jgi:hypothetical protein
MRASLLATAFICSANFCLFVPQCPASVPQKNLMKNLGFIRSDLAITLLFCAVPYRPFLSVFLTRQFDFASL